MPKMVLAFSDIDHEGTTLGSIKLYYFWHAMHEKTDLICIEVWCKGKK